MLKRIVYSAVTAVYTASAAFLLPIMLHIAFNYTKGPALNQDGIMFIPFGFGSIAVAIVIGAVLWVLYYRRVLQDCGNRLKPILIAAAIVPALIVILLNLGAWESFFECLAYFGGLNLGRQI